MTEKMAQELSGVPETLLITLYSRAMESQRPDALIKDEKAVALVAQMSYDFSKIKQIKMDNDDQVTLALRNREFDRYARDFLARHPDAVVVHIGCGLDSRFERVDNGSVEWYDLDVPEVIALRQKLLGGEAARYHSLPFSAFDPTWFERVKVHGPRPFLFLAEGVFMYFPEEQIKSLVCGLRDHFPGAELVFDAFSPYLVRMNNLRFALTHYGARYHWGLKRGQILERWAPGIHLLDDWSYFDRPEPRLAHIDWMRHIPLFARVLVIYHYGLM
jgi:O-methyltransferase involved in polyketide biosynthesis